jgi:hypothetical protein
MKYAWIENTIIRDTSAGNPFDFYHPDIASHYDTQVPDDAQGGDTFADGVLTKRPVPEVVVPEPVVVVPPTVSIITYKMLFTSAERIATKNSVDEVIIDLMQLTNDPHTTVVNLSLASVGEALDYMTSIGILAEGRKAEILLGVIR